MFPVVWVWGRGKKDKRGEGSPKAIGKKWGKDFPFWWIKYPLLYIPPGSIGEEQRQISYHLITWKQKQTLKQEWGYEQEAESRSVGASRQTWAEGHRKDLPLLSNPGSGLPDHAMSKVSPRGQGGELSCWQSWLQDGAGHVPSPVPRVLAESPRGSPRSCQAPREETMRSIQFLCSSPMLRFRRMSKKKLSGLHFLGHLIFYCWAWTMKPSSFLFLGPNPPPLRNLGLNCRRGTFTFYKLASLKMLKRLWKHSHFILSFIKS